MPQYKPNNYSIRLSFNDEASLDSFMMRVIESEEFNYVFDVDSSILVTTDTPNEVFRIASRSHGYVGCLNNQTITTETPPILSKSERLAQPERALAIVEGYVDRLSYK